MQRTLAIALACLLNLLVVSRIDAAEQKRPITGAGTVLAIYTNDWGLHSDGAVRLILAVWDDGRIVWSKDSVRGGAPYYSARIDRQKVTALLARLEDDGFFDLPALNQVRFGPDSKFTTILVKSGKKKLCMESWHELYEAGGGAVAASGGLQGLGGRRRLSFLADDKPEYLLYRLAWTEIRFMASGLIPSESRKTGGHPQMEAGELSWQESE